MVRITRCLVAAWLSLSLIACGGGGKTPPPLPQEALGTSENSSIASAQTGMAYDLRIWLPPGYQTETVAYPVVYAMDCEYRLDTLVGVMQRIGTKAILVNVCAMGGDRRWVDFTMPGAAPYYRFLTGELIPTIDSKYRTIPTNRVLSGHSLSGQFVLYALFMEAPAQRFFTSIISEDCTCWANTSRQFFLDLGDALAMERAMYAADHRLPVTLVMAQDTEGSGPTFTYNVITSHKHEGLRSPRLSSYNLGHVPMDGPAFSDALRFVFAAH
jgi:enterochelin esterase-like enzyme